MNPGHLVVVVEGSIESSLIDAVEGVLKNRRASRVTVFHARDDRGDPEDVVSQRIASAGESGWSVETVDRHLRSAWLERVVESNPEVIAYSPDGALLKLSGLASFQRQSHPRRIAPLVPAVSVDDTRFADFSVPRSGWIATPAAVRCFLKNIEDGAPLDIPAVMDLAHQDSYDLNWLSCPARNEAVDEPLGIDHEVRVDPSNVLAVIPHYLCHEWLGQCLRSLVNQTLCPENIVVIDDGSSEPPIEIVAGFPEVTLLATTRRIGPEAILHSIIYSTSYRSYLVQDADDWAASDRLEQLLAQAHRTRAELVGSQEFQFVVDKKCINLRTFPMDVNRAMASNPGHYLLHGSSLIARSLATRIGGFDRTLKLAADTDFLFRASCVARVLNVPHFCYFRRCRPGSLTSHPSSGLTSERRQQEAKIVQSRADLNGRRLSAGLEPDVYMAPATTTVDFVYHLGPQLRWVGAVPERIGHAGSRGRGR